MKYFEKYAPTTHAFFYLMLANIDFIVFIYCVIYSLMEMNLFHVTILFVMVFAQFHNEFYNKNMIFLLYFGNGVVLGQYLYTLICEFGAIPEVWAIVIGFYPHDYVNTLDN